MKKEDLLNAEVGDTVYGANFNRENLLCLNGTKGTVIRIDGPERYSDIAIGVEFEIEFLSGHSCEGKGKEKRCRFFFKKKYDKDDIFLNSDISNLTFKRSKQFELEF